MKKGEKSVEGPAKKEENLGEKLKRVGKKGGHTTPVLPFWRLEHQKQHCKEASGLNGVNNTTIQNTAFPIPFVSARKLAASVWELHHYKLSLSKMMMQHHQGGGGSGLPLRLRRGGRHHHNHHLQHTLYEEDERGGGGGDVEPSDPSPSSPELPKSAGSLRRHVAASIMKHHRAIGRNNHAVQPLSPASYSSSMEVAPYNPAVTPGSSVDLKGRIGETSYSLKTSSELLKVLNRIWILEEQHTSNMSLMKALKKELEHARARIKGLMRDQQADRREIDELMKQIAEDKLVRKNKEWDRISDAVQSVRHELEDERKLRKRSESLHRTLARELYEAKTSLATTVKDLDKERKSRMLLEDLCDEFASGIRDYEQELRALRQKFDKDWRADHDRLILHVSESWLDERMQMKQEVQSGLGERISVLDKLSSELETFLHIKQKGKDKATGNAVPSDTNYRWSSLESIPLNVAVSAPQHDDDSAGSDSHCFEIRKPSADLRPQDNKPEESHIDESGKSDNMKTEDTSHEQKEGRLSPILQLKLEENMAQAISQGKCKEGNPIEASISKQSEIHEAAEDGSSEKKNKADASPGLSSNFVIRNLLRSHYRSESGTMRPGNDKGSGGGNFVWTSQPSPVRQWTDKLPSQDHETESSSRLLPRLEEDHEIDPSSRLPQDLKENTLKAKLIEARSIAQHSRPRLRSRLKGSKISL